MATSGDRVGLGFTESKKAKILPSSKLHSLSNHLSAHASIGSLLSHRYEKLLHAEKFTDCSFHIGNNQLKGHKIILAAASPVFEAMFFGPIRETDSNIEILDMTLENFQVLLHYIYTGKVDFDKMKLEDTIELYYGAEKYILNELIDECLCAVTQKLRFSNILPALELSFCMNLNRLLEICMNFFTRCCLSDSQFVNFLKKHYCHIPKDCLKQIIEANKELNLPNLLWFVMEWCQQECEELGMEKENACISLWEDLQLPENKDSIQYLGDSRDHLVGTIQQRENHLIVERSYYKACRPITIDWDMNEWKIEFKCDRFVSLTGVLLHSRLPPSSLLSAWGSPLDYNENFLIEIKAADHNSNRGNPFNIEIDHQQDEDFLNNNRNDQEDGRNFNWSYSVIKQLTKYNSNLLIKWPEGLVLSPDFVYEMKISWQADAYGAEYPCSLMSTKVDGIQFNDLDETGVSILKGLRIINLV